MSEITITVRASRAQIIRAIRRAVNAKSSVEQRQAMAKVGAAALKVISDAFIVKVHGGMDAAGLKWPALSPVTIRRRQGRRPPRGPSPRVSLQDILRETGKLLVSLTPSIPPAEGAISPRVRYQVLRPAARHVTVGTSRPYANLHHTGGRANTPQRRLWAPPGDWPTPWWQEVLQPAREAVVQSIIREIEKL